MSISSLVLARGGLEGITPEVDFGSGACVETGRDLSATREHEQVFD